MSTRVIRNEACLSVNRPSLANEIRNRMYDGITTTFHSHTRAWEKKKERERGEKNYASNVYLQNQYIFFKKKLVCNYGKITAIRKM